MTIWNNLSGTTIPQFTIGRSGVTIWQGTDTPDNSMGSDGDLYLRTGSSPGVYQRTEGYWQTVNDTFVRQTVQSGDTAVIADVTNYLAVVGPPSGVTNLTLPDGVVGAQITIKDESGAAATNNIIVVGTIDGQSLYAINSDFGSVTLSCSGSGGWFIIRRA